MKLSIFLLLFSGSFVFAENEPKVLLVSPPELKEAWVSYAKLRGEAGTPMKVITTAEISETYQEGDLAHKIRLCVRKHIDDDGFHSIILGGDSSPGGGLIPDRDTFHDNMWGHNSDVPTDIYYISATSWDSDGDGVYGEFEEDKAAISYPDGTIALGRIPVRTAIDVAAYGEKVSSYLASIAEEEESKGLVLTCTVQAAYPKVYRSGVELIPEAWPEGNISFFFSDVTSWDGEESGVYDLNPEHLVDKFNEGSINKWHIHGHGLIDRWMLEDHTVFSFEEVAQLTNFKTPAIITTVSCFTGEFDSEVDPCITEAMIRHPGGGAVAIVAPSCEGKPHFHDPKADIPLMIREGKLDGTTQTMTSFWISALAEKSSTGLALMKSKASLAADAKKSATYHQGICEINLLGDPTLPVK